MHRVQKWIRDFFSISHAQANGIMVLLPMLTLILLSEPAWRWYAGQHPRPNTTDQATLDSMIVLWNLTGTGLNKNEDKASAIKGQPSAFNPNTAVRETLMKLGFSEKLSLRIIGYRNKGGQFRVRSDLLKIYGMDTALYKQLHRFIELPVALKRDTVQRFRSFASRKNPSWEKIKRTEIKSFDLNDADTTLLKEINGIGSKLSARIIKYRDALGGFISFDQVAEVFGLDSGVVDRLSKKSFVKPDFVPLKLNINTAAEAILAAHPYISNAEARLIVTYRFQHGNFNSIEDLAKLATFREHTMERIKPYLTITGQ